MSTNTNSVGSATTMPTVKQYATSKLGCNLNQLLDFASGNVDRATLQTVTEFHSFTVTQLQSYTVTGV